MEGWWLESGRNPTVGWREDAEDPIPAAVDAATEIGKPVVIHERDCERGRIGGEHCTCRPRTIQPPGRA